MLGEGFDIVAAVTKDALVAIDEGNAALACSGVHERGIVGHETEVLGISLDPPEVHGADGPVLDRSFIGFVVALVSDGQSAGWHNLSSEGRKIVSAFQNSTHGTCGSILTLACLTAERQLTQGCEMFVTDTCDIKGAKFSYL